MRLFFFYSFLLLILNILPSVVSHAGGEVKATVLASDLVQQVQDRLRSVTSIVRYTVGL